MLLVRSPAFSCGGLGNFNTHNEVAISNVTDAVHRGTRLFQGSKVPRFQGSKVPRFQGSKVPRFQGSKVPRFQGSKVPRFQGSRPPICYHIEVEPSVWITPLVTSRNQGPPSGPRPPRRGRQQPSQPASPETPSADQGDLWADAPAAAEPEAPPPEDLDAFISQLEPPDESSGQVVPTAPVRAPGARRHSTPATSLASRPPEAPPYAGDLDYEDGSAYYAGEVEYSMLRNPYVLAGLAVAIAIVAAVFVVILFGSGGGGSDFNTDVINQPRTPLPGQVAGFQTRSIAVAAIREGPGQEYFEIGLLRSGNDVSVLGRDADAKWFEILVPGSNLKGWVLGTALKLPDNATTQIAVVSFTPIPKPSVVQPTAAAATPTATEQALGAPDLELATLGGQCQANEPITLALRNVGTVTVTNRQVSVTVSTPSGVISQTNLSVTLAPGQALPVATGQQVQPPRTTISVVFVSAPQDSNPANNVVTCTSTGNGGGGPGSGGSTAVPPPIGTSTPGP